jgi:aldose 1-epimerase
MKDEKSKAGAVYQQYAAMCLETQGFPDAMNHPNLPLPLSDHQARRGL